MAASAVASPLCTWLLATCMSMACEKDHPVRSSLFQSPRRLSQWARRRKLVPKCISAGAVDFSGGLISSFCGPSIQNLMSSCLAFEPCKEYYSSKGLSSSLAFFGENGFSFFGSKQPSTTRRQRRMNRAAHAGNTMAVAVQPSKEVATKQKPLTKQRRVVVTGVSVVSPVGHDPDVFYNNLLEGVSGISEIESFDCTQFPTRIAGEIKSFSTDGWVAPKLSKRADKFMLYLLAAGKKALADGGITEDIMGELNKARCGVLIGSAMGGMKIFNDAIEALRVSYKKMNPFCVPFATTNMGSAMLAMDLGWMGPNYSISTACATSNFCILNAANHIIRGETDVMLCGGSDAVIIPIGLGGFVACRALSQRNSDPAKASRPWDTNRDGFVMGEGAGVLLLEELEHAKSRGANIYAEFLGGSFTCDAYHMTEPHPDGTGIVLCIEKALAQAGIAREDVNYVNAHATSTQAGDLKEYQALIRCFGQNPELRVNSTKSMTGHLLGAAGAVEAVATVKAIQTGWVHPNVNLENPDQGVDTNVLVGAEKERLDIKVALSNSFGFGGHNSSILFAPYQ
ncbi:3-oxoacyl-[acyl-carrier-protein] synthase II, chloroplastic-like [Malania oleifera]|uniref:3-oxoacyl-[acyl-carrier-protein] synthase II, chloroplastic-like n=1 Tax=Malania oleifera TaxID=397392 RepID=UPI0025ADFE64|nr:3-oxoacyl-[acyl-carrier-protein] synthase II, chloroplastic-like [Malania oleifera]XP_057976221.1 3-oxoacyl-[acyl-carrier-protein] synthase II, chloroplastic-like [Malania oleifera]XP_057976222.1 3-oxoacyl-[acyl-carrier-protein] synthase II, chloroplastic-like [Malania oleifera]